MPDGAAVDTDVLLKAAAYKLAPELVAVLERIGSPAALGLTHLIGDKQMVRKRGIMDRDGARAELAKLMAMLGRLEPDDEEIALAAELATVAQDRGLPLDAGEAQLVAIVIRRQLPLLVTGDKRALSALTELVAAGEVKPVPVGRLACFEQVVEEVAELTGRAELRAKICAEPNVDGAMRLVFSCGRDAWDPTQMPEAIASFIQAVREDAGDLLADRSVFA